MHACVSCNLDASATPAERSTKAWCSRLNLATRCNMQLVADIPSVRQDMPSTCTIVSIESQSHLAFLVSSVDCTLAYLQAERWGSELLTEDVEHVDLSNRPFTVKTSDTEVRSMYQAKNHTLISCVANLLHEMENLYDARIISMSCQQHAVATACYANLTISSTWSSNAQISFWYAVAHG